VRSTHRAGRHEHHAGAPEVLHDAFRVVGDLAHANVQVRRSRQAAQLGAQRVPRTRRRPADDERERRLELRPPAHELADGAGRDVDSLDLQVLGAPRQELARQPLAFIRNHALHSRPIDL
jgi:hypothetical protein